MCSKKINRRGQVISVIGKKMLFKGPHPRQRSSTATAISNGNLDQISPCMGSVNRNHHHDLQIAVAVAVDQNFLIFGGRSLKSRLRLLWCMGRSDQILSVVPLKTMLYSPGHQSRGLTLLRTAIQLRKIEQIGRCVCGQTINSNRNRDLAAHRGCDWNRCRGWGPLDLWEFFRIHVSPLEEVVPTESVVIPLWYRFL